MRTSLGAVLLLAACAPITTTRDAPIDDLAPPGTPSVETSEGVVWTRSPRASGAPEAPLHGQLGGQRFRVTNAKFVRGGGGDWRFEATAADGEIELTLPLPFAPRSGACMTRPMSPSLEGRLSVSISRGRTFSNVFAYGLELDRANLVPYQREREHTVEGQLLGYASGKLYVTFDAGAHGAVGPGWVAGTFDAIPVRQHGDRGELLPCAQAPTASGPIQGKLNGKPRSLPGAVLEEYPADDNHPRRWVLTLLTTPPGPDGKLRRFVVDKGTIIPTESTQFDFQGPPRAGLCLERTADHVISGPTLSLDPLAWQLHLTSYQPPTTGGPGKASGSVVLDWREGSGIQGAFTDIPVIPLEGAAAAEAGAPAACQEKR